MKKAFMILGACIAAAFVMVSCQDDKKPDNKDNKDPEENLAMDVQIDGDFTEWDALTADTADGEYTLYDENIDAELNGMLRLKLTSDADNIYVYTELLYENIFVAEGGPFQQGGSWTGFLPSHPGTPGALIIYVGTDSDDTGNYGARAYGEEESMWSYMGFDAFPQYYFCWDVAANKMAFGWNQNNWPQNHGFNKATLDDKTTWWGLPLDDHGSGWWGDDVDGTPVADNTVSDANTFKFSGITNVKDPVTKKDVQAIKIEFAMDRSAINEDGTKVVNQAVIGAFYENVGDGVETELHQTDATGSGKLPSGSSALVLKLK
ncbi:MAG: hypothetical protein J5745_02095 [Bacteroidales bacterium]|nr:hypothetical protein [Bacteroidales bacterium]